MPGHRTTCYYCKSSVLSRDIGLHILKNHSEQHFTGQNLKDLHKDKYLSVPLQQMVDNTVVYFCIADNSCIRHAITADLHFKGKKEKHREAVLALREKFPLTGQTDAPVRAAPLMSLKDKERVQAELVEMLSHIWSLEAKYVKDKRDTFSQNKRVVALFQTMGFTYDLEELKELHPTMFPGAVKEEEEDQPEEEEVAPEELAPEEDHETVERKIEIPEIRLPKVTPTMAKPNQNIYLPHPVRNQESQGFSSMKIIQSTKRPPTQ